MCVVFWHDAFEHHGGTFTIQVPSSDTEQAGAVVNLTKWVFFEIVDIY